MKRNRNTQQWITSGLAALALATSSSLGLAADITYSFDSDVQGWYAADGNGTVTWGSTNGRGGGGCLVCTIPSDGTNGPGQVDPRVDVAYDTLGYFDVEYDVMVDTTSGTDANTTYGNLQMVDWDANWNWHSEWYGSLGGPGGNFDGKWKHIKQAFTATYGARVRLQLQIAAGTAPYSTNVIIYIDNVIIRDGTPPNKAMAYSFTWPEECAPDSTWGASSRTWSQATGVSSNGPCCKEVVDYGSGNTGWQDAPGEFHDLNFPSFEPSKDTYLDFDLLIDAPTGLASYGQYEIAYWWSWTSLGAASLSEANIGTWKHYSFPIKASAAEHGLVLHPGGNNMSGVVTYYIDNITLWKPASPPTLKSVVKGSGKGGVQITMDTITDKVSGNNQWQREAIVTPSGGGPYNWSAQGVYPVSYSFTITNFPDPVVHHGFEAHMFLVNGDTDGSQPTWNSTYGGMDWNVPDILKFSVENDAAGGAIARISWKTNLPNGNPPAGELNNPVYATGPTVIGTWTLTFSNATDATVTGPGGVSTNFTMPAEAVTGSFSPSIDYLQFGMFKNDGAKDGHNDLVSGTFGAVELLANGGPVIQDFFPGPGLTANYAWRKTTSSGGATAVQWVPPDIAWWVTWTQPDDAFELWGGNSLSVPLVDAGVGSATGYTYTSGATKTGGVPAANVPPGDAVFFQMRKPLP
jgi:hypothetical protein